MAIAFLFMSLGTSIWAKLLGVVLESFAQGVGKWGRGLNRGWIDTGVVQARVASWRSHRRMALLL